MANPMVFHSIRNVSKLLTPSFLGTSTLSCQQVREGSTTKHRDPKFRNHRRLKVSEAPLPYMEGDKELGAKWRAMYDTPEYIYKLRYWNDRTLHSFSSGTVFEVYEPPENDPSSSILKNVGVKTVTTKGKDKLAIRKIKSYDDFNISDFVHEAQDVYIKAHECLVKRDTENIVDYVTIKAIREMLHNMHLKTVHWKYLESLEPHQVVRVRTETLEEQVFAQITVRQHSQQLLAIYDRFGRLTYGSEVVPKDVLEYVVYEKDLSDVYGKWRIIHKIIPNNTTLGTGRTFRATTEDHEPQPWADAGGARDPENMINMANAKRKQTEWTVSQ